MKNMIGEQITKLRNSRGYTQEDLADIIGVSKQTVSNWETGLKNPRMGTIQKIADHFKVSKSYIIDGIETSYDISSIYSQLKPVRQQKVYKYAENQLEEQNSNIVDFKKYKDVYIQSKVSAGCGIVDLDQQHKELISYCGYVPKKYDLAFQVAGNSMEPLFRDGEVIFVKHEEEVRNGQIGVVTIDDEAYIKKIYLENDCLRLVSLNKEYDDILANGNNDIKVIGRVIL